MDIVETRSLQNGSSKQSWLYAWQLPDNEELLTLNRDGWNIYVGAAPRPKAGVSGDANIEICRVLFADFDGQHFPAGCTDQTGYVLSKVEDVGLPVPSMVVNSGHGQHCYWRLRDELSPDRWKMGNRRLSELLGSDPSVSNPERILRLAGTVNYKPPVANCDILKHDCTLRYPLDAFVALRAAQEPKPERVQPPRPKERTYDEHLHRARRYAATWPQLSEGGRNQNVYRHIKQLYTGMALPEDIARLVVGEWNDCNNPPLPEKELQTTIDNALKYSSKESVGAKNSVTVTRGVTQESPSAGVWRNMEDGISGKRASIPWLVPEIDRLTHCLLPNQVVAVVGEPGASKSFWMLEEFANWHEQGIKVAVLEAEKSVTYHLERLAAQRSGYPGFLYPEWQKANPDIARQVKAEHEAFMDAFGARMTDNNQNTLTITSVIDWVRKQAEDGCRLILIDPLTVVDRESQQTWEADKHFIRSMQTIVMDNACTVLFVLHPTKQYLEPGLEHIGGGAAFSQFADCVLWLYSHTKDKEQVKASYIQTSCGLHTEVEHDRSIVILKSRYSGEGKRIACRFTDKLRMKSEGIIVRKPEA
jgi:KaiC/GvpD/RAD55 family RecA-like ATPase